MPPKFGTSGLRGLVTELTEALVADYVRAFLAACPVGSGVFVAQDLRPSSPRIAATVIATLRAAGLYVTDCGTVPTPALALAAMRAGAGAIMVTGSHIPVNRNGLKFYLPTGEIAKTDEEAIVAAVGQKVPPASLPGPLTAAADCGAAFVARYAAAFGPDALAGLKIGVYEHSSVARDLMTAAVRALGGTALPLARSDTFIPVDTEAVEPETRTALTDWVRENRLDALISTDGDGDRPMLVDETGEMVIGDVLGALTARFVGASTLCTPVSSNGMIDRMPAFRTIRRTRIGSPFVIAAMEDVLARDPAAAVVGFEPNGGFLLGFEAALPAGPLAPLMTRDSLLPHLAPLTLARQEGQSLSALVAALPQRFTAADRITGIEPEVSGPWIGTLTKDKAARAAFFSEMGDEAGIDLTDGLRVTFASGDILHLRPSGNAPELRCYAESDSPDRARALVARHLSKAPVG